MRRSSEHFGTLHVSAEAGNNWALISSDIKKILRALNDYYANVLHKSIDISSVDANLIGTTVAGSNHRI